MITEISEKIKFYSVFKSKKGSSKNIYERSGGHYKDREPKTYPNYCSCTRTAAALHSAMQLDSVERVEV